MEARVIQTATSGSLIIAPAVGAPTPGGPVHFLFSIAQVEDILGSLDYSGVPLVPSYIGGVADWRGLPLPILSLELLLGLADEACAYGGTRMLVARKTGPADEPAHWKRAFIRIAPGCRLLSRVPKAEPLCAGDFLAGDRLPAVKGIYGWDEGLLVVPHLEHILEGALTDNV